MKASVPVSLAAEILQDTLKTSFSSSQLVGWWNDAQRAITTFKPDASVITGPIQLVANSTKQTLPSGSIKLQDITRNLGADGTTPGNEITLVERGLLDSFKSTWHIVKAASVIKEYAYSDLSPLTFYVYPQPNIALYVEASRIVVPTDCADEDSDIAISNIYVTPGIEWMLYRCFSRDSEETPNYARAQAHYNNFKDMLGIKTQTDRAVSPKNKEQAK